MELILCVELSDVGGSIFRLGEFKINDNQTPEDFRGKALELVGKQAQSDGPDVISAWFYRQENGSEELAKMANNLDLLWVHELF